MSGRFITLEGGEGAGKTTQARLLAEALAARGLAVLRTREPGGAPGAERLRALLLSGEVAWSPPAEVLLHFAARAEHVERTIRPALAAGTWVVCDRFADSTLAYQGYGQGADRGMISTLAALLGIVPDVTLVLDVSAAVAAGRLAGRGAATDRYEAMDAGFHARVAAGFRDIALAEPGRCALIDADVPEETVHGAIMGALAERLGFAAAPPPPTPSRMGRGD
ncbi:MAG TPA: dTMP kinase [Acetobacteraceae bacterium]|nr:dTMP kinase [Acetobacteraceae bacterium]